MERDAHGSFGFEFKSDYTLITAAGAWNVECAAIYKALLMKRTEKKKADKRGVIIDGRNWEFETPEATKEWISLNKHIEENYKKLYVAYFLSAENLHLSQFLLDKINTDFKQVIEWRFFLDLEDCVSWLAGNGIDIQNLTEKDFPKPVPASHYLPYI